MKLHIKTRRVNESDIVHQCSNRALGENGYFSVFWKRGEMLQADKNLASFGTAD